MTIKEKLDAARARQQSILDASRAAGNDSLSDTEQREFDELTAQIAALNTEAEKAAAVEAERSRVSAITEVCRTFGMDPASYITEGKSVDEVKSAILEDLSKKHSGIEVGSGVTADEADKFRAAAADALCLRAGVELKATAPGASELRGYSLKDLAREAIEREGKKASNDAVDMLRSFTPESSFPAILDTAINKSIVEVWKAIPTTFDKWTAKGSLPDFKVSKDREYAMGNFSEFKKVQENGELENDTITQTVLPTRQLEEYGKSFSMTRKAFVDDDIGFIAQLPGAYAKAAKRTIENQVYGILFNNSTIYDGKALFHNDHHNLIGSGAAPSQATIQAAINKGRKQTDVNGANIFWDPKYLIVPIGYEFDLAVIFRSAQVVGSANNDINPLYNYPLEVIQVPALNSLAGSSACPWFVASSQDSCRGIQVDYLNGQEIPSVRRMEKPGVLGFHWDMWLDWGVTVRDFRGLVKNPGTTL